MRTTVLYSACLGGLVSMSCSQTGPGTGPVAGGPPAAQAGSAGSAVVVGGGGTGGSSAPATGGSGGGVVVAGGSGGAPPASGGAGGSVPVGGAPASGGTTSAGAGGAAGGPVAAGGSGGGGLTAADIVPELHGFYWEASCSGTIDVTGKNCPMSGSGSMCTAANMDRVKNIPVKGTTGQTYTINIEVRGVVGTRCYTGGTRASSAALNETGNNNWWYVGGTYANPTGWWNSYELKVTPSTGDASGDVYYFNGSGVQGGDACEREATYLINYKASFKAKGGGSLALKIHDQNCKGLQNCGTDMTPTTACTPRTVDLTGMAAQPPANFMQPPTNMTWRPQWMLIAVTSVTSP